MWRNGGRLEPTFLECHSAYPTQPRLLRGFLFARLRGVRLAREFIGMLHPRLYTVWGVHKKLVGKLNYLSQNALGGTEVHVCNDA